MAAAILPPLTRGIPQSELTDIALDRLWRAHVEPADWRQPEVTVFVEASGSRMACQKIAGAIAALELRKPEEVAERIYNCTSAEELIAEGMSEYHALRLFETGWTGGKPTHFVPSPLVLTADPGPLLRIWSQLPQPTIR